MLDSISVSDLAIPMAHLDLAPTSFALRDTKERTQGLMGSGHACHTVKA